jgi:hypothetical protein
VLPEGTNIKMVSRDTFKQYKEALSGLTEDNVQEVTTHLVWLGLGTEGSGASGGAGTRPWQPPASGPQGGQGSFHPGGSGEQQGSQFAPGTGAG